MFRFEGRDLVFDGWEKGISDTPYQGLADLRNVDVTTTAGEASVAFANASVTLPPVFNAVSFTATASTNRITLSSVTGLYENCAIVLNTNSATGLSTATVYYVRNISGLTFQVSLYPASAIINITADGSGTLTTYQYGNQRNLTNNGSPVSYWEAPEIGGVLLCDLSNYIWLWQQGSAGLTPENSLLFLGNIGGIGAATQNQTGVAYWKGYVCVIQQPATIDLLNWETFASETGSAWIYDGLEQYLTVNLTATLNTAANMIIHYARFNPSSDTSTPSVLYSNSEFTSTTSTTATSATLTLESGDTLVLFWAAFSNNGVTGITFNSNAMNLSGSGSSSGAAISMGVASYQAASTESGTIVATYDASIANKLLMYAIVRNIAATPSNNSSEVGSSITTLTETTLVQKPNLIVFLAAVGKNANGYISFSSDLVPLFENANASGSWSLAYLVGQGQTETLKKNVPVCVGDNDILYWGSGAQYIGSLQAQANFNPSAIVQVSNQVASANLTYNLNGQALDLPEYERVESLVMANNTLYAGVTSNKLYPWDTISPSFNTPVELPEYGMATLIPANNTFYSLGGNLGRVYLTNGSSVALFKEIPEDVTGANRPYFFFWDGNVGNGELYFSMQAYPNGSETALDTVGGVWAINANTKALRLVQKPLQGYDVLTRMVCPVGHGQSQTFLRPDGQGLLLGYTDDSSHYLEFSTALPYTDYSAYIDTDIVPVGTYFNQQTFENIEYKLGAPLVTGESIRVSQRSNLSDSFVQIAEFTNTGLISDQAPINWQNVQWVQFRIELKSTVTTPSYVRLRELRLR